MPSEKVAKIIERSVNTEYSPRFIMDIAEENLTTAEMLELASELILDLSKSISSILLTDSQKSSFQAFAETLPGSEERKKNFFNSLSSILEPDLSPIPKKLIFVALGKKIAQEFLLNIRVIASRAIEKGLEVAIIVQKDTDFLSCAAKQDVEFFSGSLKKVKLVTVDQVFANAESGPLFNSDSIAPDEFVGDKKIPGRHALGVLRKLVDESMIGLKNLATVADILRYMHLEQFGGYYLDWDDYDPTMLLRLNSAKSGYRYKPSVFDKHQSEEEPGCKKEIPEAYDFGFKYAGKEIHGTFYGGNDMLGSPPHHPILQIMLQEVVLIIKSRKALEKGYTPQPSRSYDGCKDVDYICSDFSTSVAAQNTPRFIAGMDFGPKCLMEAIGVYFEKFYKDSSIVATNKYSKRFIWPGTVSSRTANMFDTTIYSTSFGAWARKPKDLPRSFDDSDLRTTSKPWSLWGGETKGDASPAAAAGAAVTGGSGAGSVKGVASAAVYSVYDSTIGTTSKPWSLRGDKTKRRDASPAAAGGAGAGSVESVAATAVASVSAGVSDGAGVVTVEDEPSPIPVLTEVEVVSKPTAHTK